ncbi:MAG: hypothetical protein U0X39_12770 [Bacteroidales bacterium]
MRNIGSQYSDSDPGLCLGDQNLILVSELARQFARKQSWSNIS